MASPEVRTDWTIVPTSPTSVAKAAASKGAKAAKPTTSKRSARHGNREHQPLTLAHAAAAELLTWLGFTGVQRGLSRPLRKVHLLRRSRRPTISFGIDDIRPTRSSTHHGKPSPPRRRTGTTSTGIVPDCATSSPRPSPPPRSARRRLGRRRHHHRRHSQFANIAQRRRRDPAQAVSPPGRLLPTRCRRPVTGRIPGVPQASKGQILHPFHRAFRYRTRRHQKCCATPKPSE